MNVRNFLGELLFYFPIKQRSKEEIDKLLDTYVNDILLTIENYEGYECDFSKLLQFIRCNRTYNTFPSIAEVVKDIPKALKTKPIEESYSGREGEIVKRFINGIEYEFTIVPNHWGDIKTIIELDREIKERMRRNT